MLKKSIIGLLLGSVSASQDLFQEGSESRDLMRINGNMAAAFTPLNKDGDLDFTNIHLMAQRYEEWGIKNIMIGGTTGESVSLDFEERYECVKQWLEIASKYDLNIYVHVGMNSVQEGQRLAHKVSLLTGTDNKKVMGILAMPPTYFRPSTPEALVDTMAVVASGAPDLPFWYYHFPDMTKVDMSMYSFVKSADESGKIPNLMGIKFTNELLMDFNQIGTFKDKKYNNLMGRDEILTSAITTGVADGAVGSTMNYMSFNLNLKELYGTWNKHDKDMADEQQRKTIAVIQAWKDIVPNAGNPQKAILKMTGIDFGPLRLPQENLSHDDEMKLGTALAQIGLNITDEYIIKNAPAWDSLDYFLN